MVLKGLVHGALIGFAIAAPVGPVGMMVIRRTLEGGLLRGVLAGLGAALADAFYGAIGAIGLTFVSHFLSEYGFWIRLGGGALICYLGVHTFLAPPPAASDTGAPPHHARAFLSTLLLGLANPTTILAFAAAFAAFGPGSYTKDYVTASVVMCSVFAGASLWWLMLTASVSLLRGRLSLNGMKWINRVAGSLLVAFGILSVLSAF